MDVKVVLYDADDNRVGETFMRRARQLVKQQRATWTDDTQRAIRFVPDTEDWEGTEENFEESPDGDTQDDALLMYIAKQNVRENRNWRRHIIAYVIAWPLCAILYFGVLYPMFGANAFRRWEVEHLWNELSVVHARANNLRQNLMVRSDIYGFAWMDEDRWLVEDVIWRFDASIEEARVLATGINNTMWAVENITNQPVLWYIIVGALLAWGGFLAPRTYKRAKNLLSRILPKLRLRRRHPRPPKPDPVEVEYRRLKEMNL